MLEKQLKDIISEDEKEAYMLKLTKELPFLRMKLEISQDELAGFIGVSRQTYGAIERKDRPMGWNTYLSLIFFFDNNAATHNIIRGMDAFPHKFINSINAGERVPEEIFQQLSENYPEIFDKLDEHAVNSIRTMIMIEYARCTNQSGEAVVKSFNGMNFMSKQPRNARIDEALRKIKGE